MNPRYTAILSGLLCLLLLPFAEVQGGIVHDGPNTTTLRTYSDHSVLASGDWYKIAVAESGICKLSFAQLQGMGISMSSIDPRNIRIYGNGGGMLPEYNLAKRKDDLQECAIQVAGESDGTFDASDYILFYARGPVGWKYNALQKLWEHIPNVYSDSAYYFISAGGQTRGKRIESVNSTIVPSNYVVTDYQFRTYHDKDAVNLIKSGRSWYGEIFDIVTSHNISLEVPDVLSGTDLSLKSVTAARATSASSFDFTAAGSSWKVNHSLISTYYNSPYASGATIYKQIPASSSPVDFNISYNKSNSTAVGWLDCIDLTARCSLSYHAGQFSFRDVQTVGAGMVSRFVLANAAGKAVIWDVTDPVACNRISPVVNGNSLEFTMETDTLHEFLAFDESSFISPRFVGKVQNQDLHALANIDMVIISPPLFFNQASRLANLHSYADDLNCIVLNPEAIYNEFSSGAPDLIAVRDFLKMLYDRGGEAGKPRYLLLFGDGSYDNKNRLLSNTNFLPTWQTSESFDPVRSGVSDDYYGLLDDMDGLTFNDKVDIGIGRIPVQTLEEATAMVDKVIHYAQASIEVMGDWRNVIAFIADDEDGNDHVIQADNMATYIGESFGDFNLDKIYMDAYTQVASTAGARYPEVNKAITQRVEKGCLIMNYTGHGGETGLAHEQVLEVQDINSWTNYSNMPVFVTATCEFSRFDDPGRASAGELVLLNQLGGGIALFTTTRPTYGSPNFDLNKSFYKFALSPLNGHKPRMGDIMMEAKRESGSNENGRKFILLGDPALAIAFPELKVVTSTVNGHLIGEDPDTLSAYAEVHVTGFIADQNGNLVSDFNGAVYPTVFDKAVDQTTLGNDGGIPFSFSLQKSILYKGKVDAVNGEFSFTFIVPKDIAYRYDFGKLSYYATDSLRDASGFYSNLVVGGSSPNQHVDVVGPDINLYMNDFRFTDGGVTGENPWLVAYVQDESGINTIGSGIGHDITAILDGKSDEPYVLNDFYESDINTYRSGTIRFPFSLLEEGEHTIEVKVWDIYNNSSESSIRFVVKNSTELIAEDPMNYPNPYSEYTDIVFRHNQQGSILTVNVEIYNLAGQLLCTMEKTSLTDGSYSTPIRWDGRTSNGSIVGPGIYFYKIKATNSNGSESGCSGKIVKNQ
ncbi:MAG: type IX secretion system sortase PorU [Bacteroidales bacterium]|nr:type IX secretion system sortase PorU [Bacteroidales bacterium]